MRAFLFALSLCTLSVGYRAPAEACGNVIYTLDDATRLITEAEALLDKGKFAQARVKAANTVVSGAAANWRAPKKDRGGATEASRPLLEARKQRVVAIAWLRLGHPEKAKEPLAKLVTAKPDDPGLQARYAEALLATGDGAAASAILVDLEKRDLMPDAPAWRALGRVHAEAGDAAARDRALTRCKAMATKEAACTLEDRPKAKTKPAAKR